MTLKSTIDNDLKTALLGGDRFVADTLRGLKAVILDEEVAKGLRETGLSDDIIEVLVAREVKKRKESAAAYEAAGRSDLVEQETKEADVLAQYLPEQASEDDIRAAVRAAIEELNISGPSAMGQVIGKVKAKFGTSADGALVAQIVKQELTA